MRASLAISAAFAATAIAGPLGKREEIDYVTDTTNVVVDVVTTVYGTSGFIASSEEAAAATTTTTVAPAPVSSHARHHGGWTSRWTWTSSWEVSASSAAAPTSSSAPAPAPAPVSSSSVTSVAAPPSTSAVITSSAVAPAPTTSASSALPSDLQAAVDLHNTHRRNHTGTGDVTWDADLASWAQTVANACDWDHNTSVGGGSYGQNYAALPAGSTGYESSINMWYDETSIFLPSYYGQMSPPTPPCTYDAEGNESCPEYGHFTQMIWKATEKIGCATAQCGSYTGSGAPGSDDPYFVVCNYSPPGNVNPTYNSDQLAWASSVGYPDNLAKPTGMA